MGGADEVKPLRRSLRHIEKLQKSKEKNSFEDIEYQNGDCLLSCEFFTHASIDITTLCPLKDCWTFTSKKNIKVLVDNLDNDVRNNSQPNQLLPPGSQDLNFIPNVLLMPIIQIYDCCIRMRSILRLAPFRFEDLCICLAQQVHSPLLAEIFLSYLRTIFIDDESCGITYFTSNEKDAAHIFYNIIDNFTWVEALKLYFSSSYETFSTFKDIVNRPGFPVSSTIEDKVKLLTVLQERFLKSKATICALSIGDLSMPDKYCKLCSMSGTLESCHLCPFSYHIECLDKPYYEDGMLICTSCLDNSLNGLSISDLYVNYSCMEHKLEPLGVDNCGRLYWFTIRRLFVEDSFGNIRYYSTVAALRKLVNYLANNPANRSLVECLSATNVINDINRNLSILQLERINNHISVYDLDSDMCSVPVDNGTGNDGDSKNLKLYVIGLNENHLKYVNYYYELNERSQNSSLLHPTLSKKMYYSSIDCNTMPWYGGFYQLKKDISDLKKCNKVAYRAIHEFAFLKLVQNTLINLESILPSPYLNPIWYHQLPAWAKCVRMASSPAKLASLILHFYRMIKPFALQPCWYESTGHLLPCRVICPEIKNDKYHKVKANPVLVRNYQTYKINEEVDDYGELLSIDVIVEDNFSQNTKYKTHHHKQTQTLLNSGIKNKNPPKHRIWNQKGEEYRTTGVGGWCIINNRCNLPFSKLEQKTGFLDEIIYKLLQLKYKKNSSLIHVNGVSPNTNPIYPLNSLPTLAPLLDDSNNPLNSTNSNSALCLRTSYNLDNSYNDTTNSTDLYIPGETVSQFFQRKGTPLLKSIERGLKSMQKPLITDPDILMSRELKSFVINRQIVFNMNPILSVYRIRSDERVRLARKAGLCEVKGFNYSSCQSRSVSVQNWPWCFPRPSIGRIWEIRMQNVTSIFDIAFLLKLLYACLDLNNMKRTNETKEVNEIVVGGVDPHITPIFCLQNEEGIVTQEILDARPISSDGLIYSYFVKKSVQPLSKLLSKSNYLLGDGSLFLNNKGEIDIVSHRYVDNRWNYDNDGRYVSSFRKNSVAPETLINDHLLRSNTKRANNYPYKHVTTQWVHEDNVNTILIKRFWAKIEHERTKLQTEYTLQHKKWMQMAVARNSYSLMPINQQNNLINTISIQKAPFSLSTGSISSSTVKIKDVNNLSIPSSQLPPDLLSAKRLPSSHSSNSCVISNCSSMMQQNSKKISETQTFELSYENMVVYQEVREKRQCIKPKIEVLRIFKIEELLNYHAEYLKCNLRRNKFIEFTSTKCSPYICFSDVKEMLHNQYSQNGFLLSCISKTSLKDINITTNKSIFSVLTNTQDTPFRRSSRSHKPKKSFIDFDEIGLFESNRLSSNGTSKQHRTSCCCSSSTISDDRTFLSCYGCNNVFHGVCYGMSKLKSSIITRFYCPSCEMTRLDSTLLLTESKCTSSIKVLKCLCGGPTENYTDFSSPDIIKCELCSKYSHLDCINFPNDYPNLAASNSFLCIDCKYHIINIITRNHSSSLSLIGIRELKNLIINIKSYEYSHPFLYPIDLAVVSDYTKFIKRPMDLQTIFDNLVNGCYSLLKSFIDDMMLIFSNCRVYNSSDTIYVKYANCLECIFLLKLYALCQRTDISVRS